MLKNMHVSFFLNDPHTREPNDVQSQTNVLRKATQTFKKHMMIHYTARGFCNKAKPISNQVPNFVNELT